MLTVLLSGASLASTFFGSPGGDIIIVDIQLNITEAVVTRCDQSTALYPAPDLLAGEDLGSDICEVELSGVDLFLLATEGGQPLWVDMHIPTQRLIADSALSQSSLILLLGGDDWLDELLLSGARVLLPGDPLYASTQAAWIAGSVAYVDADTDGVLCAAEVAAGAVATAE